MERNGRKLRNLAHEIADGLMVELSERRSGLDPAAAGIVDALDLLLAQRAGDRPRLHESVASRLDRLERAVRRLAVLPSEDGESEDESAGDTEIDEATRPAKYKDVESVLKYIEDEDGKSGVKLVIMNFND